jgi:acetyl esterase/lipase
MKDPEIAALRAALAEGNLEGLELADFRAAMDGMGQQFPLPGDVTVEPVSANGVVAEFTSTPGAKADRVILYLHGGGYLIGSLDSHRHYAAEIGRNAGTRSLAIHYRLGPENPYPAAVDDALAAYRYLLDKGFKPGHIAIAGDSAGGGLTVATMLAIRSAGLPLPACGFCISPWVDLTQSGASIQGRAEADPLLGRDQLQAFADGYLQGRDPKQPTASPLFGDLSGLPPLLIQVGQDEVLLDDSTRLAGKIAEAHGKARLEVWPEMIHIFHFFFPILGAARRANAVAGAFIRDAMNAA